MYDKSHSFLKDIKAKMLYKKHFLHLHDRLLKGKFERLQSRQIKLFIV